MFRREPSRLNAVNGCATEPALPPESLYFVGETVEGRTIFKAHATGLGVEAHFPVFKNFFLAGRKRQLRVVGDGNSIVLAADFHIKVSNHNTRTKPPKRVVTSTRSIKKFFITRRG